MDLKAVSISLQQNHRTLRVTILHDYHRRTDQNKRYLAPSKISKTDWQGIDLDLRALYAFEGNLVNPNPYPET